MTITKLLKNPRKDLTNLFKKDSIQDLYVSSYFLDNLNLQEISQLKDKSYKTRDLVIIDYFVSKKETSPKEFEKSQNKDHILELILGHDYKENSNQETKSFFSCPEGQITYLSYLSFLENDESKELSLRSKSKEDLKKVYCFDYIYTKLPENRKNQIHKENISESISKAKSLYQGYLSLKKLKEIEKEIELFISSPSLKVNLESLLSLEDYKNKIKEYEPKKDLEVIELYKDSKKLIEKADYIVKEKLEERLNNESKELKKNLTYLSELKSFNEKDEELLEKLRSSSRDLSKTLNYVKDDRAGEIQDLTSDLEKIAKEYEIFKFRRININKYLKKINEYSSRFSELSFYSENKNSFNFESVNLVLSSLKDGQIESLNPFDNNKYCLNLMAKNQEAINKFNSLRKEKVQEAKSELDKERKRLNEKLENYQKSFFGNIIRFFNKKSINEKIELIEDYQLKLSKS